MLNFLEKFKLLNKNQFGFRPKKCTVEPLVSFIGSVKQDWEDGITETEDVFIDLKNAFDTVKYSILLDKLNNLGLRGHMQNFSKFYLSRRQQCVNSGNVYSTFAEVNYGVPHWSVLRPLLFLVYKNDIHDYCSQNCLTLCTNVTVVKQKWDSTTKVFSQSLNPVSCYLTKNKLTMNYKNSCLLNMKARRKNSQQQIKMKNINLTQRSSLKYLGIKLDDNLNFGDHIKKLCSKLNKFSRLLHRLTSILTVKQLLLRYKDYVEPVVSYGVLVYGGTINKTLILPLESKIKQITRIFFNKPKSTSTCLERESNHICSIRLMHLFELLTKLAEILIAECHIDCLKNVIARKQIETLQAKRIQSKQLITANKSSGLSPTRLGVRIRKLFNFILKFYPNLEVQHLSATT